MGAERNNVNICAEDRFELSGIIENIDEYYIRKKDYLHNKIKVCIMISKGTYLFWNSIETIYQAFKEDSRYEVIIFLSKNLYDQIYKTFETKFVNNGIRCQEEGKFKIAEEQPDILLVTFQGEELCLFPNCQAHLQYFKLVVAITGELISYISDADQWKGLAGYHHYHPDYYIIDFLLYSFMEEKNYLKKNMLVVGNAKFDGVYKCIEQKIELPEKWKKLKGKKVLLWANTHGIYNGSIDYTCTFDLYAKAIFDYVKKHSDIAVIIRLHPAFLLEMYRNRFWDEDDLKKMKCFCDESDNLVWDDNSSYYDAYCIADGILTDGFCGVILSSLPLMKPICACYRYDLEVLPGHMDFVKTLYQAHSIKELSTYLDMVRMGEDPMYEQRKKAKERYVPTFDGKNGLRIKELIEEKFFEKVG